MRLVEGGLGRRRVAIILVYVGLLAALVGAGFAGGPRLRPRPRAWRRSSLPEMTTGRLQRHGWERREIHELERLVQTHMGGMFGYIQQATAALLTWLGGAWMIVLIPVFAFFTLKDMERLTSAATGSSPPIALEA